MNQMNESSVPSGALLLLYIENPWLDQGFDKALAMSL